MNIDRDKLIDHINSKKARLISKLNNNPHGDVKFMIFAQHSILQQLNEELLADPEKFK